MLRVWQEDCITTALLKYQLGQKNFLAMATPGAGKTRMAAHLTSRLFELDKIDLVICFTPSINVTNSFQKNLEAITEKRMNGRIGSSGQVLTYHNLSFLPGSFWEVFREYRVFVIFDEIHHCGGHDIHLSNSWGEKILRNIRSRAAYTLALSGTPWRSDKLPIALARYSGDPSKLECDYIYPLEQAILDGVCRIPKVIAIDNDHIRYTDTVDDSVDYKSIRELLSDTSVSYSDLLQHRSMIIFILRQSIERLHAIRQHNPRAAGLVVASSVKHAYWIKEILAAELAQSAVVVSHEHSESHQVIDSFEESESQWIIAIGMVSEGTNIPRLQVCCYLSRIKTELYFRQVLGRIVRSQEERYHCAYFYTLAEATLLEHATRIGEDLPDDLATVEIQQMDTTTNIQAHIKDRESTDGETDLPSSSEDRMMENLLSVNNPIIEGALPKESSQSFDDHDPISLSGQFSEELITLQHSFNKAS